MGKDDIPQIAKNNLDGLMDRPGSILCSSHETLKPGEVYLLGFNPGGSGGDSIERSIDQLLTSTTNAYLDESWEKNKYGDWPSGGAPLQKRIQWIIRSIKLNPRDICATNLIFLQSRRAGDIRFSLAEKCWPVHEAILSIVKPKLIIAFGNSRTSPYGYLHSIFGGKEELFPSGHGNWQLKGFKGHINDRTVYVAGLPHLSRYSPIGKNHVIEWLSNRI